MKPELFAEKPGNLGVGLILAKEAIKLWIPRWREPKTYLRALLATPSVLIPSVAFAQENQDQAEVAQTEQQVPNLEELGLNIPGITCVDFPGEGLFFHNEETGEWSECDPEAEGVTVASLSDDELDNLLAANPVDQSEIIASAEVLEAEPVEEEVIEEAPELEAEPVQEEEPVVIVEPTPEPTITPEPTPTIVPQESVSLTFEQKVAKERKLHPIYTQFLDASGILIKAPQGVNPQALTKAKEIMMLMTRHRPDIRANIARTGSTYTGFDSHNETQVVIIPKNAPLTSLPEYSTYAGREYSPGMKYDTIRGITGGGDVRWVVVSAVGEEYLLPGSDNYGAYYEFGHVIQDGGITQDEWYRFGNIYSEIKNRFSKYAFISSDVGEFFSGLTAGYFGIVNSAVPSLAEIKSTPNVYNFFASIYGPR